MNLLKGFDFLRICRFGYIEDFRKLELNIFLVIFREKILEVGEKGG